MSIIIDQIEKENMKFDLPDFRSGDSVKVHIRIVEGAKERIQIFEGVVIGRRNRGMGSNFTVRKISHGVGVEKIFALHNPRLEKIEVVILAVALLRLRFCSIGATKYDPNPGAIQVYLDLPTP
jgi:large subunit ribosomal protein L19